MAKPRIFISSTFYDLRQVREDLERFIKDLGYESVRHEVGEVPYGSEEAPEASAYREVELCDAIISIIGGRFGTEAKDADGSSISQNELKKALEHGIPVFIFIEKSVRTEYSTYLLNKNNRTMKYSSVDDKRVYEFIEELNKLPRNNPIADFETSADIIEYLRTQWAGLFQRYLQAQQRAAEIEMISELKAVATTLNDLVRFLREEKENQAEAISHILLANHPVFRRFGEITNTPYRVYFTTKEELNTWLSTRGWMDNEKDDWDEDSTWEWIKKSDKPGYIKITEKIFEENGQLKLYSSDEWDDKWLQYIEED